MTVLYKRKAVMIVVKCQFLTGTKETSQRVEFVFLNLATFMRVCVQYMLDNLFVLW
jgi:hypothetical protein